MTWRGLWRGLRRRPLRAVALSALAFVAASALLADFLASDLPLLLRFRGELYVLPALTRPAALRAYDNQRLKQEMRADDWAVMPLCEFGPVQQPEIVTPPPGAPDALHWLGTDDRGRDLFARLVHGARVSLGVALLSVVLYVLLGLTLGLLAGYVGGPVDWGVSRLIEIGLAFPTFFLIISIMALLGGNSLMTIVWVIGLTRWTSVARLVRAEVLRLREMEFVLAARALGAGPWRVVFVHLLPNALGPVLVNATFGVAAVMLTEAALTFLGFGTPPPTASWGEVLAQAYEHQHIWWLVIPPGALLITTLTAINLLGEALRHVLDPRERHRLDSLS